MGVKGRKKREREKAAKLAAEHDGSDMDGDDGPMEPFEEEAPMHLFAGGPFSLPPGASHTSTKLSHSERWRMHDEDYLDEARAQVKNRKGVTHVTKKARAEAAAQDKENVAAVANAPLADHYTLESVDALIGAKEGNQKRNAAITGARISNPFVGLHDEVRVALEAEGFKRMTRIQERVIPLALSGYDILGQAKTGSGKTLAFVIPVLQTCFPLLKNARAHPLLAMMLAPTKELAVQINAVIKGVGQHLRQGTNVDVRSQLITGGTKVTEERRLLLAGTDIVVGTPGRVLDHVRHCQGWDLSRVKFLVLDEADRMLADGFQRDLDAIIGALPRSRQSLLFSATNSKSVRELARLSLSKTPIIIDTKGTEPQFVDTNCPLPPPSYVAFADSDSEDDDDAAAEKQGAQGSSTAAAVKHDAEDIPSLLRQFCYIGRLEDRLRALYVFVKRVAKRSKTMIFCSTVASTIFHCQMMGAVGFHEDVLMLHGHMKHRQRVQTFEAFNTWSTGVLFCTDVAARGLDIPQVDWILQFDPPLDPTEYIHRIGRTARAGSVGNAVIFLSEEEAAFVTYLARFNITMERLPMPAQLPDIQAKLEHVLQLDPIVAKSSVNAFRAHVGAYSTHLLQQIFAVQRLDLDALAVAFALSAAPSVSIPNTKTKSDESKQNDYIKGKLKSLNTRKKEALRLFHEMKTKKQWTPEGKFVGVTKPDMAIL